MKQRSKQGQQCWFSFVLHWFVIPQWVLLPDVLLSEKAALRNGNRCTLWLYSKEVLLGDHSTGPVQWLSSLEKPSLSTFLTTAVCDHLLNFLKMTCQCSHPLYSVICQLCGGVSGPKVWTSSSCSFFFLSITILFFHLSVKCSLVNVFQKPFSGIVWYSL